MNPQMVQYGMQPGNHPPPGGGPPPPNYHHNSPVGSFPPIQTQQQLPNQALPANPNILPPKAPMYQQNSPNNIGLPQNPIPPKPQTYYQDQSHSNTAPNEDLANQMHGMNINTPPRPMAQTGVRNWGQGYGQKVDQMPEKTGLQTNGPQYQAGAQMNGPLTMPPSVNGSAPSEPRKMNQVVNGVSYNNSNQPPVSSVPPPTQHQQQRPVMPSYGPGPARVLQPGFPPMPNQSLPPAPQNYQQQQQQQPQTAFIPPYSPTSDGYMGQGYAPPPPPGSTMAPPPPHLLQQQQQQQQQQHGNYNQSFQQGYTSPTSAGYPQPGYPGQQQQQQQQPRRLNPDHMPSPIQVMKDDEDNRRGVFCTNEKGLVPPLVTTNYVTQDQGNANPRYMRSSMYNVPVSMDMMKQTAVPFALVISPLARLGENEVSPPIVNMGEVGPVRCIRCKAYMSPFMQFIDGGRRFHCMLCKATTEVPSEYFQHLDHTGQRVDRFERPELVLGAYEFVATNDYCRNNQAPKIPAMVFVIDVSYNSMKSGLVHLLCANVRNIIRGLPKEKNAETSVMRVGFITYSTNVHFYNIKSCLASPQMMVVGDVNDMFMPLLDGFLCDPYESEAVIDQLMTEIPKQFADTRETETILLPAIQAGLEALKASDCAGKLLVFNSSLPIAEAPGKLKNRDDRKLLATEKEKTVLAPQNTNYNNLGQDCVQSGCCVDLFVFNNSYIDLATIGQVSRLTGGEIFKYTYFQADIDGDRFLSDLKRNVSRDIAFDSIMRVRTSTGVRATDFYGHFFMSNTTDMELAGIDSDKAVAVEIKHDDKLTEEDGVYIQVALLYTSCSGQRRLRVLNLSLKTCSQMAELYRSCELDTIVNFLSKQAVYRLNESTPKQIKDSLVTRCASMLACYRKNCASPSGSGQLILPECMKLLPLYVNTMMKSDALSGGSDMTVDDRSFAMYSVLIMDIPTSVVYFYPRLLPLHTMLEDSEVVAPQPIRCTLEKLTDDGVYLLDNGIHMFLWLGLNAPCDFVQNVFNVQTAAQVDTDKCSLPVLDNQLSIRIRNLIDHVRESRHRSMRLTLVKQRDKMEMVFKHFLMEDRGIDGSPSYVDFLCHMHKEIRTLLS